MIRSFIFLMLVVFFWGASFAWAGVTGTHYTNGVEGITGSSLPGPGFYDRMYNVFYFADDLAGEDGDKVDVGLDLDVFAHVQRPIWVTDVKIFGADYFVNMIIPFIYTDYEVNASGTQDDSLQLGDIFIEPIGLAWHGERWDAVYATGVFAPTGRCCSGRPAYPGKDYWSVMFTLGTTLWLDPARTFSVSILNRYEIHTEKDGFDLTPGDDYHFEWGIGKNLPADWNLGWLTNWKVGASGYAQWQVTNDKGDDVTWDKDKHDRIFAAGPEVQCFIPRWMVSLELRSLWEFGAVDCTEGHKTILTVTKIF